MALRAFFDESGTSSDAPGFVMGGFLATAEEWDKAADAWAACLRESPSIDSFHHVDTAGPSGAFFGWPKDAVQAKLKRLAGTIAQFHLQGFVTAISHSWFAPRDKRAAKGMFGSRIYDHAFLRVVSAVLGYVSSTIPGDDKVDFIFERRPELKQCISAYEDLFEDWSDRMIRAGSCIPSDDETNVALQMADLLSWEFLQVVDRNEQSPAFSCINQARQIIYLPCSPPKCFPYALAVHSFGQTVKDEADLLQKRIYGDAEKSLELAENTLRLACSKADFDANFKNVCLLADCPEFFAQYLRECAEEEQKLRLRRSGKEENS
jgi:hypothetical protein